VSGIRVSVSTETRSGRLYPKYDREADILAVTSDVHRDWLYGVDIDGNIVFDVDASRVLANFDLHVGKRLWEHGQKQLWPQGVAAGSLVFARETLSQKSFNLPLRLRYDGGAGVLRIEFGTHQADRMVGLSKDCIALLYSDQLVGFLVRGC
jgi:hypothetical protein